ncbi:MAG: hypothetical protein ACI4V7_03100 [Succinivibrionaceae bacterium]
MSFNYEYDIKYTDNPYIDLLVHLTKNMVMNCVVKNERTALKYETVVSRERSNKLIKYKRGKLYELPDYDESEYVEANNYYRMLQGLPPYPTESELKAYREKYGENADIQPLYEAFYIPLDPYIYMITSSEYGSPDDTQLISAASFAGHYLHEFRNNEMALQILKNDGVLDQIEQDFTGSCYKYIYHMGAKAVDSYTARTAPNFALLYVPNDIGYFSEIYYKFIRTYERNRDYTLSVIYSEAYAFGSIHYDDFIQILILIQTMIDMISEVQEYIINKDVFDSRTIRYLFESYGIDYYKEIPVTYQIRIIKNINLLLKYKSSNKNIEDILLLFDHPDIQIYTYYLMKTKKVTRENMKFYTSGDMIGTEDFNKNYDMCFLKVPITDQNISNYIEDKSCRRTYDFITKQDPFWDGVSKVDILTDQERENYHNAKRREILSTDFSCIRTKYLSVDVAIDITKMSYQVSYFLNMLFDKHYDEENLKLSVNSQISENKVKLSDLFCLIIALNYIYNDIEDDIVSSSMEANLTVNGFDFDNDWTAIYNALQKSGKGFMVELDSNSPGAFLSGRYSESEIWNDLKNTVIHDNYQVYDEYVFNDENHNNYSHPVYLQPVLDNGSYADYPDNMGVDEIGQYHKIDLTWDTPYSNSNGDFVNTSELIDLNGNEYSDLDRMNKLKEIYYTNTRLYNHLTYMMRTAESKSMYDIYKTVFESFMETKFCHEFYNLKDYTQDKPRTFYTDEDGNLFLFTGNGQFTSDTTDAVYDAIIDNNTGEIIPVSSSGLKPKLAATYTEFLRNRNYDLAKVIYTAKNKNKEDRQTYISMICDYIASALEVYFDTEEWKYLYNLIPTRDLEAFERYILKMVIFFKSWKTQILDQSVDYIIDDPYQNQVRILDDMELSNDFVLHEKLGPRDYMDWNNSVQINEKVGVYEKVYFSYYIGYYNATKDDFVYDIDEIDNSVTLLKYITTGYAAIRIPATIEGYSVKHIEATCFSGNKEVSSIDIPEGVLTIG